MIVDNIKKWESPLLHPNSAKTSDMLMSARTLQLVKSQSTFYINQHNIVMIQKVQKGRLARIINFFRGPPKDLFSEKCLPAKGFQILQREWQVFSCEFSTNQPHTWLKVFPPRIEVPGLRR